MQTPPAPTIPAATTGSGCLEPGGVIPTGSRSTADRISKRHKVRAGLTNDTLSNGSRDAPRQPARSQLLDQAGEILGTASYMSPEQASGTGWEVTVTHSGAAPMNHLAESLLDADLYDATEEDAKARLLATLSCSHLGLIEAIRQAQLPAGTITPRLLERLLNDLGDQTDQLPCLQHALMRTWDQWRRKSEESGVRRRGIIR